MRTYTVKNDSGDTQQVNEGKLHEAEADGYLAVVTNGKDTHRVEYKDFGAAKADGFKPISTSDVSKTESAIRSLGQGASLGFGDEIVSAAQGIWDDMKNLATGKHVGPKATYDQFGRVSNVDQLDPGTYVQHRGESRAANLEAEQANPGVYATGKLIGGLAPMAIPGATTVGGMAALGAAQGLGESNADLTKGDVTGAARDAAIGAGIGATAGVAGKALGALGSKVGQVGQEVIEDVATAPMGQSGAQMGMVVKGIQKVGQAGKAVDAFQDKIVSAVMPDFLKKGATSGVGNMLESGAIFGPKGVAIQAGIQGAKVAPEVAQKVAQTVAPSLESLIPKMGKYSKVLSDASLRGGTSLAASHYIMMQTNPEYREQYEEAQNTKGNQDGQ